MKIVHKHLGDVICHFKHPTKVVKAFKKLSTIASVVNTSMKYRWQGREQKGLAAVRLGNSLGLD